MSHGILTAALLTVAGLESESPAQWETVQTLPFTVKVRRRPHTNVYEVWAEGTLHASVGDIQDAVTQIDRLREFMPYMTESRTVGEREPDGSIITYARIDLPLLSPRDFVHRSHLDRDSRTDSEGVFENHWSAVPDRVPRRPGVVRLVISEGGWLVRPASDGASWVTYRFTADPGGWIPTFVVNRVNAGRIADTLHGVEREAQRRAREAALK